MRLESVKNSITYKSKESIGSEVSVCLLTYNHAHLIESTLASVQQQTLKGYEIIVSDDCSTDGTWEILQRLAFKDSRIRPIRTPRNLGMAGNANFAVAHTERAYIAMLHHDDLCRADLLEKWLDLMVRHPLVGFVFNAYGVDMSDFVYHEVNLSELIDGKRFLENYLFPRWGCPVRGTAMIRRNSWVLIGGMRPQFGLLADIDLWMRLSMVGSVGYVKEPVIVIRQNRPDEYPEEYKSRSWSWVRQRYLYEIHATNRLAYYNMRRISDRLKWLNFRLRLTIETFKWLTYGVIRDKSEIIKNSHESKTPYDLFFLHGYRFFLKKIYQKMA